MTVGKGVSLKIKSVFVGSLTVFSLALFPISSTPAFASDSVSYDFNSPNQLTSQFDLYEVTPNKVSQSVTGGIGNSGSIFVDSASSRVGAVLTSTSKYSMGPIGSTYTFESFVKSVGTAGFGGMGFTSLPAAAGNTTGDVSSNSVGTAVRPSDALGISIHGSGFGFHNGATTYVGYWKSSRIDVSTDQAITTIKESAGLAPIQDTSSTPQGSPDSWFKFVLKIDRVGESTFNMRVEVWPANADGSLRNPSGAEAIFEIRGLTNSSIVNSPSISSYFSVSGHRFTQVDNYSVSLAGGSSVIAPGAPVVLTDGATLLNSSVALDGRVTATGGTGVTERGFVFSTSPNPTIADYKVLSGSGTGSFTEATLALPNGTYFFRAFATNSTGTSYGVTKSVTISGSSAQSAPATAESTPPSVTIPASVTSPAPTSASVLAATGMESPVVSMLFLISSGLFIMGTWVLWMRRRLL